MIPVLLLLALMGFGLTMRGLSRMSSLPDAMALQYGHLRESRSGVVRHYQLATLMQVAGASLGCLALLGTFLLMVQK